MKKWLPARTPRFCERLIGFSVPFGGASLAYRIIGLRGGTPLTETPQGERLELDPQAQNLAVVAASERTLEVDYENSSGDWVAATFSPDGQHLLLGCPYGVDFRVWRRAPLA